MATSRSTTAKKPAVIKPASGKTSAAATGKTSAKTATARTSTTKKPATTVKKPAAGASKPAAAVRKAAPRAKPAPARGAAPTPEQRYRMIQDAAYFIAEKNGFASGAMDYWIAAEAEIDARLSGKGK